MLVLQKSISTVLCARPNLAETTAVIKNEQLVLAASMYAGGLRDGYLIKER